MPFAWAFWHTYRHCQIRFVGGGCCCCCCCCCSNHSNILRCCFRYFRSLHRIHYWNRIGLHWSYNFGHLHYLHRKYWDCRPPTRNRWDGRELAQYTMASVARERAGRDHPNIAAGERAGWDESLAVGGCCCFHWWGSPVRLLRACGIRSTETPLQFDC